MSVYCSLEELTSVPSSLQPPVFTALGGPDTSGLHQGSFSFARKSIMVFFKCIGWLLLAQSRNTALWFMSVLFTAKPMARVVTSGSMLATLPLVVAWFCSTAKDKPSQNKSQADGWACDSVDRALACPGMYETLGYIPSVTSLGGGVSQHSGSRGHSRPLGTSWLAWATQDSISADLPTSQPIQQQ